MITVIRRYFKNGSQVILWVIVAAFIIGLMPMTFRQITKTAIWAIKVNDQEIGYQEFLLEKERQREHLMAFRAQYGEYADWLLSLMGATDPQALAVRTLIRQELLNQFADKLGIYISNAYVEQKLGNVSFIQQELADVIPAQLIDPVTGIDQKMLGRYLKHFNISAESFERQIERLLVEKLVTDMVASTMYVPTFDIRQKLIAESAKRSFSVLTLSLDPFLHEEQKKEIPNDKLAAFYGEHNAKTEQYTVPQKRTGMLWTFTPKSYHIAIPDAQVEEYYEKNKKKKYIDTPAIVEVRRILVTIPDAARRAAMQEKAARIKDEIVNNPAKFAEIAKRVSDDKESAARGGLLAPFARGSQEPAIDRAAFVLQKDGDISDVIESSHGLEILQRVSKTAQKFKPFEQVKQDIKSALYNQEFQKQFMADMRKVGDNEALFASFMKEKGSTPKELKDIMADESPVAQQLFKLSAGQRTFFVDGERGMVVRLDKIHESHVPALDAIKSTVVKDYHTQQAQQALKKRLNDARQALSQQSFKDLPKTFQGELMQTGWIAPDDQATGESLKKKGLPLAKMLQMEKIGGVITEVGDQRGYVVRLDEIEQLNTKEFKEKENKIARSFEQERLQQYLEGFVASLYRNATIETNESVITLQV